MNAKFISFLSLSGIAVVSVAIFVSMQLKEHSLGGASGSAFSSGAVTSGWPTTYRIQFTRYALPSFAIDEYTDSWSFAHLTTNGVIVGVLVSSIVATAWVAIRFITQMQTYSIEFLFTLIASIAATVPLHIALKLLGQLQLNKSNWWGPPESTRTIFAFVSFGLFCFAFCSTVVVRQSFKSLIRKNAA